VAKQGFLMRRVPHQRIQLLIVVSDHSHNGA
jgi:hypothetical protein